MKIMKTMTLNSFQWVLQCSVSYSNTEMRRCWPTNRSFYYFGVSCTVMDIFFRSFLHRYKVHKRWIWENQTNAEWASRVWRRTSVQSFSTVPTCARNKVQSQLRWQLDSILEKSILPLEHSKTEILGISGSSLISKQFVCFNYINFEVKTPNWNTYMTSANKTFTF